MPFTLPLSLINDLGFPTSRSNAAQLQEPAIEIWEIRPETTQLPVHEALYASEHDAEPFWPREQRHHSKQQQRKGRQLPSLAVPSAATVRCHGN